MKAGFIHSEKLGEILSESPIGEREKVYQLFEKVAPAGLSILPWIDAADTIDVEDGADRNQKLASRLARATLKSC